MVLADLDKIRDGAKRRAKPEWQRSSFLPAMPDRGVLAFDPSLAKTGWALVTAEYPYVVASGILPTTPLDGEEGNLQRGVSIFHQVVDVMNSHQGEFHVVAHEAPPASSHGLFRTDATKSAGLAIRIAASLRPFPINMTSDTHGKKRMVGRTRDVSKADMKQALVEFWPHLPSPGMRWNEDIRDAVVVGILTHEEFMPHE